MSRIINAHVDIDIDETHRFFENRTHKDLFHRYNYVNYQDNNPKLALERDIAEKSKILPYLGIESDSKILDIGCGVGRWGDELITYLNTGVYVGVDYSKSLIEVAEKSRFENEDKNRRIYCVGSFQKLKEVLTANLVDFKFDIILINGVLMYINDKDVALCLKNVLEIENEKACIYLKESVGVSDRYTLKDNYSEELASNYNAIYRSVSEYSDLFDRFFGEKNLQASGELFESKDLHNRKETTGYFWIYKT